ncbi:MAG TPA: hypothetical protein VJ654_08350 [Noviherbaspirillum sp.]|nr:hypothetical protein [Noviherbaspirillum sp.]
MKIDTSAVTLAATHSASSRDEARESLRAWVGDTRPDFEALDRPERPGQPGGVPPSALVSVSPAARRAQQAEQMPQTTPAPQAASETKASDEVNEEVENDPSLRLIKLVVEMLTGTKIKLHSAADHAAVPSAELPPAVAEAAADTDQSARHAGFGIEYESHRVHSETEQTSFHAQGIIRTQDGKEISFELALGMQRSFTERSDISLRAGDGIRKDPLVLNFDGTAAQLQSQRFSFDLDSDGQAENAPLLSGNSAYLALDRNDNGKIDSGSELFGAASGNGFSELALYDSDGNGWIDESDPVFGRLQLWLPHADGAGKLETLAQHGVGALLLAHADTPFEIQDADHRLLGAVRASSVYLSENGKVGSLQQIDLVV